MTVLLAEDDPNICVIVKMCLEKFGGHVVSVCGDGESALREALSKPYDLLLLDGMLPKKSGFEIAKELRGQGRHTPPIIFLSAVSENQDSDEWRSCATGFISKPFDPLTICDRIQAILSPSQPNARTAGGQ